MKKTFRSSKSKAFYATAFAFLTYTTVSAQKKPLNFEIESQTIGTTNNTVPFWMRSNQFGSIPLSGVSQSFIGRAYRDFTPKPLSDSANKKRKLLDWGFGFEGRANLGKGSNLQLIEGYGKARVGVLNIIAGRSKNVMGLNGDTTLSSGNFAVSGNAPGIPRIELSIPEYYTIPILDGLLSVKGNFVHGWVGRQRIYSETNDVFYPKTYFHQKSIYLKLGKENARIKLYSGFNHQVYWGNEKQVYAHSFNLSPVKTFYYVVTGKAYGGGGSGIPRSKIGNQLGSLDIGIEYNFDDIKILLYRQNFYDVGALSKLANLKDGISGVTLENRNYNKLNSSFKWKKILGELFYSKDQAGYPSSTATLSGDEDYYNNYYYSSGWAYKGLGVGNPLITKRGDEKDGQATFGDEPFINNRVIAVQLGMEGEIKDWIFVTKFTYSNNYGTYGTSKYGHTLGPNGHAQTANLFSTVTEFSCYFEAMKTFNHDLSAGFASAVDTGELLNNSMGLIIKIKKTF